MCFWSGNYHQDGCFLVGILKACTVEEKVGSLNILKQIKEFATIRLMRQINFAGVEQAGETLFKCSLSITEGDMYVHV